MDTLNLISAIFAFFAIVVSILSFGYQTSISFLSLRRADMANDIAKQALDIALRDHKKNILPDLKISIDTVYVDMHHEYDDFIMLDIQNSTHSKTTIETVEIIGHYQVDQIVGNVKLPTILGFNNRLTLMLHLKEVSRRRFKSRAEHLMKSKAEDSQITFDSLVNKATREARVTVIYSDEVGNRYVLYALYSLHENSFLGTPTELLKMP